MHQSFTRYTIRILKDTTTAITNLAMFIPYVFSVLELSKTLFAPWKNITTNVGKNDWSLNALGQKLGDIFASRFVGFLIRASLLVAYLFIQVGFTLSIPFVYLFIVLTLPLSYLFYTITPSPKEQKDAAFNQFMKRHLADEKNQRKVIEWFDVYYNNIQEKPWWSLERLLTMPPLGRDLTFGYTNTLDRFCTELTLQQPHHKHLIGRKKETEIIQRILSKSGEANVLLNGEPGVGRKAIVEALARSIYKGTTVKQLAYKRLLELDIDKVLAESQDNVKREDIVDKLIVEAIRAKNIILFINNLERYVDNQKGHFDLTPVLAKHGGSSDIHFMATTTPYMYQKHIYPNKEIADLFDKVDVQEISPDEALRVLLDVVPDIEKRHGVSIVYEALEEAISLSDRYIQSPLPEKAIELLDEAAVYSRTVNESAVNAHTVRIVLEQKTHVPTEVSDTMRDKLLHLEDKLRERVLFQDQAIRKLSSTLRKAFVTIVSRRKPLATMLFLGPTGVGKTETAKAVTEAFFDTEDAVIRFDMSNYQSHIDIAKLIGSPELHEPGQLTEAIRNKKYGTLLLDELEKAHKDLLNIFLTILDEGYFTDGMGKRVDCTNLIIIATSNAGADFIYDHISQGASTDEITRDLVEHLIHKNIYSPEFLNRFDGVVVYKPLYKEAMFNIAKRMIENIAVSAKEKHGITIEYSDEFIHSLVNEGYDPRFGARNMNRLIQDKVEDSISKAVLENNAEGKTLKF